MSEQRSVRVEYIGGSQRPYEGRTTTGRLYIGANRDWGKDKGKWVPDTYKDKEWARKALSLFVNVPAEDVPYNRTGYEKVLTRFDLVEPGIYEWATNEPYTG